MEVGANFLIQKRIENIAFAFSQTFLWVIAKQIAYLPLHKNIGKRGGTNFCNTKRMQNPAFALSQKLIGNAYIYYYRMYICIANTFNNYFKFELMI